MNTLVPLLSNPQVITLAVLVAVVAALIWDKGRSDVVALAGAAVLLLTGVVRPIQVQSAFASPAIITLASLFVIAYAMEMAGLLDAGIRFLIAFCRRIGRTGLWIVIAVCGAASAFLNNTPIVVLAAPVIRDTAASLGYSAKRFLIPLSYAAILGGGCTLIGTSTNLLVSDMAGAAGQARFGIFEITPVGVTVALAGGLYLLFFSGRLIDSSERDDVLVEAPTGGTVQAGGQIGDAAAFATERPLRPLRALVSLTVFVAVIALAAIGAAPIAACAFAGAVLLILLRIITADEAYSGLRPDVLMLIAGMLVLGIALRVSGVAEVMTELLVGNLELLTPLLALILIYGVVLFATELLSNATVAVLFTPIAVSMGEALQVSPRPFLVAVMMAGSAAFATPFGYQTNALVYQMGRYRYMDFVRVGLPLNLVTWVAAIVAIRIFFPF
ncbi:SLC13 family permease [Sphingomonas glaciei]|uniref:SLC13 family permease n=1 Tax=Sphingomonas glaciei TaxID=2938948 RepID=A0ABY5MXT4_9SPHN|nr:SLC13 family permease [Sphingomonas glaciei]UUR08811.1 SLC13 family permease [Sphingomonas glaciei]